MASWIQGVGLWCSADASLTWSILLGEMGTSLPLGFPSMPGVFGGFSGSPLMYSPPDVDLSHPNVAVEDPLGGSSPSESVDVRSTKIVFGSSAAGTPVAELPSGLCCPVLLELSSVGFSLSLLESLFRPTLPESSAGVALHVLVSAFLCFLPPLLLFRRLGAAPALEWSGALSVAGHSSRDCKFSFLKDRIL